MVSETVTIRQVPPITPSLHIFVNTDTFTIYFTKWRLEVHFWLEPSLTFNDWSVLLSYRTLYFDWGIFESCPYTRIFWTKKRLIKYFLFYSRVMRIVNVDIKIKVNTPFTKSFLKNIISSNRFMLWIYSKSPECNNLYYHDIRKFSM